MTILFYCKNDADNGILSALQEKLPDHTISHWPDCDDKASVTTAVVWQPPTEFFDELVNLENVISIAAGVDHLLSHPGLPDNVNIVRLTDAGMAAPMSQFVLYGVLHAQRQMTALAQSQRSKQWNHGISLLRADEFHVGILGAGELSLAAARRLVDNGYKVSCWSRSEKNLDEINHYAGDSGLDTMLPTVNALVCLLPLTEQTTGILSAALLAKLPDNSYLINPGRGAHLDEQALLAELDSARLSGALLDVFSTEPLPETHPFWTHPRIIVTPHIAAPTEVAGATSQMAQSIKQLENGEKPSGLVNRTTGY